MRVWLPLAILSAVLAAAGAAATQDRVTDLSPLAVVAIPEAPVPVVGTGAANLSVEQTASIVCEAQRTGKPRLDRARLAHDATVAARDARRRAMRGEAARPEMNRLELERQRAVVDITFTPRPGGLPTSRGPLRVAATRREILTDGGQRYLLASGTIHNPTRRDVEVPVVNVHMLDARGFVIASQSVLTDVVKVTAGGTESFELRLRNPALYTSEVRMTLGPPLIRRTHRDCEFFEPAVFNPRVATDRLVGGASDLTALAPAPKVGEGAPYYSASELADIEAILRLSVGADALDPGSEAAVRAAKREAGCTLGDIGMDWRTLMRRADLAGEAWFATRAAEESRRELAEGVADQAMVDERELARQAAVLAFIEAAPAFRSGNENIRLSAGMDPSALNGRLAIDVGYENLGKAKVWAGPVMLTLLDRFGVVHRADVLTPPVPVPAGGKLKVEAGWLKNPAPSFLLNPRAGFERALLFAPCGEKS